MSSELLYSYRFDLPASIERCFELFADPKRLNALTPAWFDLRPTIENPEPIRAGIEIDYRLKWRGFPLRWTSRIVECEPPHLLTYEQARGPYLFFRHEHRFRSIVGGTEILDQVRYRPFGGRLTDRLVVRRDLATIFAHRARRALRLLEESGGGAALRGIQGASQQASEPAGS